MAIVAGDLKIYLSGGTSNSDPDASLGGDISTTELVDNTLHNLFAKVGAAEALAGSVKYRGIYIKNTHGTLAYEDAIAYISTQTTSTDTSAKISVADEGQDASMQAIVDEDTAPSGEVFSTADGTANGLALGNLAAGSYIGLWIERTVDASATAFGSDTLTIGIRGETTDE
ncbi:MAG: hypothetical protein PHS33_09220 [Candidatus Omnitrophica bacterium]|nr:hypothetical protein [Candidatus Omnitrophota bacterium]